MGRVAFALLLAIPTSASAQVIVGPVGAVLQPYAFRYATPKGEVSHYGYRARPVYGVVGFLPQPPIVVVNVIPPFPLSVPPEKTPHVEDPTASTTR